MTIETSKFEFGIAAIELDGNKMLAGKLYGSISQHQRKMTLEATEHPDDPPILIAGHAEGHLRIMTLIFQGGTGVFETLMRGPVTLRITPVDEDAPAERKEPPLILHGCIVTSCASHITAFPASEIASDLRLVFSDMEHVEPKTP